jgi:zinc protease
MLPSRPRARRPLLAALAALTLAAGFAPATGSAAPAKKGKPTIALDIPVQSFTLDNGLRVYVVEDHSTPAFNINITYDVGSRDEIEGRTGFAHFFEHMMFQGSKNVPDNKIGEYTERAGGVVNAGTSFDETFYFHSIPSQYLDMVLWAEADRLSSLEITKEAFEVQRAAVKSEKDRSDNNPQTRAVEYLVQDVFAGTPYNHMPIGSLEDLDAAVAEDTQKFFDTYYRPNNAVMVIVGDVDFAQVQERVTHYFASIPRGEPKPPPPAANQTRGTKVERVIEDSRVQQPLFVIAWPTVGDAHADRVALDLLGSALFGGESARVPKLLVDEKKLVAFAGGGHFLVLREAGAMLMFGVPVEGASLDDVKKLVVAELEKVAKKGLDPKELEKVYNQAVVATVSTLATNSGRANAIATGAIRYDDPKAILTDLQELERVTNADIKRVAATYTGADWAFYELRPK